MIMTKQSYYDLKSFHDSRRENIKTSGWHPVATGGWIKYQLE